MDLLEKCRAYKRVDDLRDAGLYPFFPSFQGPFEGGRAPLDGATVCKLSSCDYRALSSDLHVIGAAQDAVALYGTSVSGPRVLGGNLDLHSELEADLAGFFDYEAALIFPAGYLTNLSVVSSLAGHGDQVFLDERAHASLVDGARLAQACGAEVHQFAHARPDDLARMLEGAQTRSALVATEGVFSHDGEMAPLEELVAVCEGYGATLLVDEDHGVGVFGAGRGASRHLGVEGRVPLMTLTFSTALASQGGAVLADARTVDYLRHTCRSQIYSAGLSPADTAAAHAALRELRRRAAAEPEAVAAAEHLRRALVTLGYQVGGGIGPLVPVRFSSDLALFSAHRLLAEHGVHTDIAAPDQPDCLLRVVCTDAHTPDVLDAVIGVFANLRNDLLGSLQRRGEFTP